MSFSRLVISIKEYLGTIDVLTNIPSSLKSVAVPAMPFPSQIAHKFIPIVNILIKINMHFFIDSP